MNSENIIIHLDNWIEDKSYFNKIPLCDLLEMKRYIDLSDNELSITAIYKILSDRISEIRDTKINTIIDK